MGGGDSNYQNVLLRINIGSQIQYYAVLAMQYTLLRTFLSGGVHVDSGCSDGPILFENS